MQDAGSDTKSPVLDESGGLISFNESITLGSYGSISKEEFKDSQEFLKKELKKIISTVQDKLIKHNDNNEITFKKNKFKSIIELYAESGKWDYWSIED